MLLIVGELAEIIERRLKMRRLDCPSIVRTSSTRMDVGSETSASAGGRPARPSGIVHDLRRSGVRHLIRAGVPPHTVMAFSGHRTPSMLKRYDIIALDDLRAAAEKGSAYAGTSGEVVPMRTRRERAE